MFGKDPVLHAVLFVALLLSALSLPRYAQAQSIEKPNAPTSRIVIAPTDSGAKTEVYWSGNLSDQTVATINGQQIVTPGPTAIVDLIVVLQQEPLAVTQGQLHGQTVTAVGAQQLAQQAALINTEQQQVIQHFAANGLPTKMAQHYQYLLNALAFSAPMGRLQEIAATPGVKGVYFDYRATISLNESVPQIGAPAVWAQTDSQGRAIRGEGMRVAIIDTGIDYTHPDLGGCFGASCRVIGGYDFVNNDADPMDDHSHGTHVAGIVAANGTLKGVAPAARMLAYKVCDAGGSCQSSHIIAALEYAANPDGNPATPDAVDVVNMSLGGPGSATDPLSMAANQAVAQGIVVVAAAGNAGAYRTIGSPGAAADVLTVGAVSKSDALAGFSSKGWAGDYVVKPEITAPGGAIQSAVLNGGFAAYSGTSMASPHVAGAAALVKQAHPTWMPGQIKSALVNTALDLGLDPYAQGNGRLRVDQALNPALRLTPGVLSFGLVNADQPLWQRTQSFAVTNLSNTTKVYTLTVATGLAAGLTVTLSANQLTLAPQQSVPVTVTLAVDNSALPFLTTEPYSYAGAVLVQDGAQQRRVPFTVIKTSLLQLNLGEGVALVVVHGQGANGGYWSLSAEAQPDPLRPTVLVPPGVYDVIVAYVNRKMFVIKENVQVTNHAVIDLPFSDAKNRLITRFRRLNNQTETVMQHHQLGFKFNPKEYWIEFMSTGLYGPDIRISNLSSAYYYEMCSYLRDYPAQQVAYDLCTNWEQGITQSQTKTLVAANLKKMTYRIEPHPGMTEALLLPFYTYGGLGGFSIFYSDWDWMGAPFERTIYHTPLASGHARTRMFWSHQRNANKVESPIGNWSPVLAFPTKSTVRTSYTNYDPNSFNWVTENRIQTAERWSFPHAPVYWAGHFANSADQVRLNANALPWPFNGTYAFLRDQWQTFMEGLAIPYVLTTPTGTTNGSFLSQNTIPITAGPATLVLNYTYPFRGGTAVGQVTANFNTNRIDKDPPTLLAVQLVGADGPNPETLTGAGKVVVRVKDNTAVNQVTLAVKFSNSQSWRTLTTIAANDTYTGTIPAVNGLTIAQAALRIDAVDSSGNRIRNEITPAFIAQTTRLSGRVTDASGAPLSGVTVGVYQPSGTSWVRIATAQSGANGDYRFINRPPGKYRINFVKSGYQTEFYNNSSTVAGATDVTIAAGVETSNINASLNAATVVATFDAATFDTATVMAAAVEGRFLSGQVVDAQSGAPVPNATVTLYALPDGDQRDPVEENATTLCPTFDEVSRAVGIAAATVGDVETSAEDLSMLDTTLEVAPAAAPQATDANGRYGWAVAAGCWYMDISAAGYSPVRSAPLVVTGLSTPITIALPPQHQLFLPLLAR